MKILFLTRYSIDAPSSRYRVYQYLNSFKEIGIICEVYPLMENGYISNLNKNKSKNISYVIRLYIQRFFILFKAHNFDFLYFEKELFPYIPPLAEFLLKLANIKYIVDYDDATFHDYDQHNNPIIRFFLKKKIAHVIAYSNYVVTGSPYLTTYAKKFNKHVEEIPTSINIDKYQIRASAIDLNFVIGWIGSKTTSKHVLSVIDALQIFSQKYKCVIRLIGFDKNLINYFKNLPVEIIEWSEEEEVNIIKTFSVGIMPLIDAPFERGKCGFKLIQYMACAVPTISTPLEANVKINRDSQNLFANNSSEWISALEHIYNNREKYIQIGIKNRKIVEEYYSIQTNVEKYIAIFNKINKFKT